jgi:DNA-binding transcriptional LysR family regulator
MNKAGGFYEMTLKTLQIFVTVYREGSITGAACRLGITQPAVSSAIRELEHHFAVKLFQRSGRSIAKTPNADTLYDYASHITALYSDMNHAFRDADAGIPLRIGSSISIGTCILPRCIRAYIDHTHSPMPYVKIDSSDIIVRMIEENQLDYALIEGSTHSGRILSEPLITDRLIPVCSPDHPLASRKQLRLDDLREENFLLREKNSGTRQLAESVLAQHSFVLTPAWESTSTTAIMEAVSLNLGISILPARMLTAALAEGSLRELSLPGIRFQRQYSVIYHQNKYLTRRITDAIDFFKQYIRAM